MGVTITYSRPIRGLAKAWKDAIPIALAEVGAMYQRKILPRHFRAGAAARYGYKRRTMDYWAKKTKRYGNLPLVYSGELRAAVLGDTTYSVTPRRLRVKIGGLNTEAMKNSGKAVKVRSINQTVPGMAAKKAGISRRPDYKKEIMTITDAECGEMWAMFEKTMKKAFIDNEKIMAAKRAASPAGIRRAQKQKERVAKKARKRRNALRRHRRKEAAKVAKTAMRSTRRRTNQSSLMPDNFSYGF